MEIKKQSLSRLLLKNSSYALLTNIILKFGGLIFTLLIARILLPELFGIYALVLSVVTLALTFTDLGLNNTFLRYFSESFGKGDKSKSKSYLNHLLKIKFSLIFVVVLLLAVFSKTIAYQIYHKPLLFYPLLFSCLFVIVESLWSLCCTAFIATNYLKPWPLLNLLLQISKISFSVLFILLFSYGFKVSGIFIGFFISGAIVLFLALILLYKKNKDIVKTKPKKIDLSRVNKYWKFMILSSISLAFFTSLDTLILGGFVSSEYIGYYRASSSLIFTLASLLSLSSIFLPIFTQINGKRFERGFNKTLRYLLIISIPITVGLILLANHLILFVYGKEYLQAVFSLYSLSLIIISTPLIDLYSTILQSREKSKIVGNSVLFSLSLNIILSLLVVFLFKGNFQNIVMGVGFATSLSRIFLLGILIFYSKKYFKLKFIDNSLIKILFSSFIMFLFLFIFNKLVEINLFFVILEIILGALIYFISLFLMRGLKKQDIDLFNNLVKWKRKQ